MKYQILIFDLDGTLTDSKDGIFSGFEYSLAKLGIPMDPKIDFNDFIGPPLSHSFKKHFHLQGKENDRAVKIYREYYERKGMFQNRLYDGVLETLTRLKNSNHILILATMKLLQYTETIMAHFAINDFFQKVYAPGPGQLVEDKINLLRELKTEIKGSSYLMIGDRNIDIQSAKANAITACAVTYGYGSMAELTAEDPDFMIDDVRELLKIV